MKFVSREGKLNASEEHTTPSGHGLLYIKRITVPNYRSAMKAIYSLWFGQLSAGTKRLTGIDTGS